MWANEFGYGFSFKKLGSWNEVSGVFNLCHFLQLKSELHFLCRQKELEPESILLQNECPLRISTLTVFFVQTSLIFQAREL